ncbi:hypothetical protein B0T17DRAFT_537411 [Bombardia bombarda]|uniref:Uncharacterized protein n=1 Tax=Bombardia bombarda TaxID=252184 RepID=A0AA39WN22_9PEZI|nr:hypothetical protein B0T17DRAFT_537411 [Bombardia bombarda]
MHIYHEAWLNLGVDPFSFGEVEKTCLVVIFIFLLLVRGVQIKEENAWRHSEGIAGRFIFGIIPAVFGLYVFTYMLVLERGLYFTGWTYKRFFRTAAAAVAAVAPAARNTTLV